MKETLLLALFLIPLTLLVLQGFTFPILRFRLSEKMIKHLTRLAQLSSILITLGLLLKTGADSKFLLLNLIPVELSSLNLYLTLYSLIMLSAVAHFSFDYLHKEIGFHKFFINFNLFWMGQIL